MIDKNQVAAIVDKAIEGTDAFVVDITVGADNDIVVELDSPTGVDLDFCARVSQDINEALDRDVEDYSLEVGTASLSAPFKVIGQYEKHIGDQVDVFLAADPHKLTGTLAAVDPEGGTFTIEVTRKVKEPGKKKPALVTEPMVIPFSQARSVAYHFDFK